MEVLFTALSLVIKMRSLIEKYNFFFFFSSPSMTVLNVMSCAKTFQRAEFVLWRDCSCTTCSL